MTSMRNENPELRNQNSEITGYSDKAGEAPWAMQLVLRLEKRHDGDERGAVAAIAKACVQLLAAAESNEEWQRHVERWHEGRIRKIVRRARGSKWQKLIDSDSGVAVEADGWEAWAETPGPVDAVRRELSSLQVSGTDVAGDWPKTATREGRPLVAVNPQLDISTGKLCAQVAHAAGLIWWNAAHEGGDVRREAERWLEAGVPLQLVRPEEGVWAELESSIEGANNARRGRIVDAGFTEIPPGTATVIWNW